MFPVLLVAWALVVLMVIVLGRRGGLFPPETRTYIERVRMPNLLRAGLERLYQ